MNSIGFKKVCQLVREGKYSSLEEKDEIWDKYNVWSINDPYLILYILNITFQQFEDKHKQFIEGNKKLKGFFFGKTIEISQEWFGGIVNPEFLEAILLKF